MFDPPELLDRYHRLLKWNGRWLNYWTETVGDEGAEAIQRHDSNHSGVVPSSTADLEPVQRASSEASSSTEIENFGDDDHKELMKHQKEIQEQRAYENDHKKRPPRHFIVLPGKDVRDTWEKVKIKHAEDEVQAHCGLFIQQLNDEYEMLVSRVAGLIDYWCKDVVHHNIAQETSV